MKTIKLVQLLIGVAIIVFGAASVKSMLSGLTGGETVGYKLGTLIPSGFVIAGGLYVVKRATKKSPNV